MSGSKPKNIVLTGFMGTGKTEVGRALSVILGWRHVDVDEEIVKSKGMSIREIFSRFGEPSFRDIETEKIRELAIKEHVIISTGGGAVLRHENVEILREKGVVVALSATPETILQRTANSDERPLLQVEDPLSRIRELLDYRTSFYQEADIVINTESKPPYELAVEILEMIGWKKG